jgi:NADPH:quinone reductase
MERLNMHAMLVDTDKSLVWSEVPEPPLKENDVLIEVHAAALNRADLLQRAGAYPSPPGWPEWMGLEVSGVVLAAPSKSRWRKGDKVCALLGGGGYAERAAVQENMVLPVPKGLSLEEAAAIPEVFTTSYLNLYLEAGVKRGDTVLIHAGASGLGTAAIQIAKSFGATVLTTVGSPEKAAFVRTIGADIVVNHKVDALGTVMDKHPVDIALDCVAGSAMGSCVVKMSPGGRWVVIATLAGAKTEIDMNIFFRKGLRLIGSTLRNRPSEMKGQILASLEKKFWSRFSSGKLKSIIYKTLPMSRVEEAHEILQRNENLGKVVLTL